MDLNSINANINRLLTNIWAVISFFKEFAVDGAKDVSITYINADGSESVKTFKNIAKLISELETWKQNAKTDLSSFPKFLVTSDFATAEFGDFTNWTKPSTVEVLGTITSGTVWDDRSAWEKEWLTAMGLSGVQYFYPSSFNVYRLTAPASRTGHSFPYVGSPYCADSRITTAAFVKWVQGAVPYGWWCSGLTNDGVIKLCGTKNQGGGGGYIYSHPYKAEDTQDTIIEVALAGTVDRDIDLSNPINWGNFKAKVVG